jgi:phosphoribosylanthranilate isomerase
MSLKYFVHVSSINNLSDARYCSGMMVNSLGFDLDIESKTKLPVENINEICKWVNGVDFVGEFNNSHSNYINEVINELDFNYISVNVSNNIKSLDFDHQKIIIVLPEPNLISPRTNNYLRDNFPESRTLIIDNLTKDSISNLELLTDNYEVIINPLETINNTKNLLNKLDLGLLLKGSQEIKPGYKDYDSISDYLDAIDESL